MSRKLLPLLTLVLLASPALAVDAPSVLVRTTSLHQSPLAATIVAYGVVTADPRRTVNINFPRGGEVARLMVTAGQTVRRGAPLVEFRTDPTETLLYQQGETALRFARQQERRTAALVAQKLATQAQLAAARQALKDAEASLAALRRQGKGTGKELARAPFDAVVTSLAVRPGDRVAAGTPLMQLAQASALQAELGVDPEQSRRVRPGMKVRLSSVFDHSQQLRGKVVAVYGVVDPQTRLVNLQVALSGADGTRFIPGMPVAGRIVLSTETGWAVPRPAVLNDDRGDYLFQVKAGHALRVAVQTGIESGDEVGIRGDLDPKLPVVVEGNYELRDGMAVREGKQ